jgi:ATP-binding cassette subfamily F protein uup
MSKLLLNANNLYLTHVGPPLLKDVSLQIHEGEHICLLGRNGVGKSTLMAVLTGRQKPDSGSVQFGQEVCVAYLPQEVQLSELNKSVYEMVASGLGRQGESLVRYQQVLANISSDTQSLKDLEEAQQEVERCAGWDAERNIQEMLSRLKLEAKQNIQDLSGGMQRTVLLAKALVSRPDILFLDEPTNHLDLQAIQWLEDYLKRHVPTLFFVSHDRAFMRRMAKRILDLDRGELTNWKCDYDTYLQRKEAFLEAEAENWRKHDESLAKEEAWVRKGLKARRKRNMGRVRKLERLRAERRERREQAGQASIHMQEAKKSGKIVFEVDNVSFAYGKQRIIEDFSTVIQRGDKVGIVGPNGCGKSTFLNLLLGGIKPDQGQVNQGTNLEVAYSDQLRSVLDENLSARDNIAGGNDFLDVGDKRYHVLTYLKDFLFTPERAQLPARVLSGGERNRLLLATLLSRPANVLVLDEPTNDLDFETLELLEAKLVEFEGTVLLVSHDRQFIENVVTSTLVFAAKGQIIEYAGAVPQWDELWKEPQKNREREAKKKGGTQKKCQSSRPRRLSFNESQELQELPEKIEALELELEDLHAKMADKDFYLQDKETISATMNRLEPLKQELEENYQRWEELEEVARVG